MMKKYVLLISLALLFWAIGVDARSQVLAGERAVDYPEVPRVSAYEAYIKFKSRKAILIQAGGESFERRHILGAFHVDGEAVQNGKISLPNYPRRGVEIFTYCY